MRRLFEDQNEISFDLFDDYIQYSTDLGFYYLGKNDEPVTIGYPFSIEAGLQRKGIPWNDVNIIFFDEFLEYGSLIEDETAKFINIISTIVRKRGKRDVKIYLVANTVTPHSPYFDLFGINIKKLRQGQIMYFKHSNGVTGVIEYCKSMNIVDGIKQKNDFLGFDNNPTANMVLYGEWEYNVVNTQKIDGIGWDCERRLFPCYVTAYGEVYEFSIYESDCPIVFCRKINTQNGEVRKEIRYNLSYDNTIQLNNKNGYVPMVGKLNKLVDEEIRGYWDLIKLCIEAKRVIYDNMESGSDFMKIYEYIK